MIKEHYILFHAFISFILSWVLEGNEEYKEEILQIYKNKSHLFDI